MTPLLKVTALRKAYNVPVLKDFDFELMPGEVHALVGSNGAGKSTFARILSGLTEADSGEMQLDGQGYLPKSKREAETAGIVMVLQELHLIGTLSIAENIFLNRLPNSAGFIRFGKLAGQAQVAMERVGLGEISVHTPAQKLGVGQQQLVEIAAALAQNCRVLILDEPTAALTNPEIETLFANIRKLQQAGVGIIYVSHRMDEIQRIANRITVLRDGMHIATHAANDVSIPQLIKEMAGHELPARRADRQSAFGASALRVTGLSSNRGVKDVSLEVRHGEILGLAGLIGSGRTETLRAIFGADAMTGGKIFIGDREVTVKNPRDAVRAGIGMVPEDRKQDGLLLSQSIRVNTTLSSLPRYSGALGWMNFTAEKRTTAAMAQQLATKCDSWEQRVSELSGGNQQKTVIARWLARDCDVLLFDEPTRGIDAAAKDSIYHLLRELAAKGKAIMVVSSELEELALLCDRVLVMSAGRIAAEFNAGEWTPEKITEAAFSGHVQNKTVQA